MVSEFVELNNSLPLNHLTSYSKFIEKTVKNNSFIPFHLPQGIGNLLT